MACLICETSLSVLSLPCSCRFCEDCLSSWFLETLKSYDLFNIKCPNHKCFQIYSSFKFLKCFSIPTQNHLETLLLKKILSLDEEYVSCSNNNCKNISFKTPSICMDPYICPLCGETCKTFKDWRKKSNGICNNIIDICNQWLENIFSGIYQDLFTKQCPKCKIPISKNGGCKHMSCRKCGNEFCWSCLEKWHLHKEKLCFWREILKWLIIFLVIILGANKIGLQRHVEEMIIYGDTYYVFFISMNLIVAYCNFSLFLLFYLPFLLILYSIFY